VVSLLDDLFEDEPQQEQRSQAEVEPQMTDDDAEREFSEAERRFYKAGFYRQILEGQMFSDSDPVSNEVETEFKAWARQQMSILLNVRQPEEKAPDFSKEEVLALKELAKHVLTNAKLRNKVASVPTPPPAPKLMQQPIETKKPEKPRLQAKIQNNLAKTEPKKAQEKIQPKPEPKAAPKPVPKPAPTAMKPGEVPAHDTVVEENGQYFKIHWAEVDPSAPTVTGAQYITEGNSTYRVVKKNITKPKTDPDNPPVPIKTGQAFTLEMANHANRSLSMTPPTLKAMAERSGQEQQMIIGS
jgi:hypothetical protein